jgi:hypothetical protein
MKEEERENKRTEWLCRFDGRRMSGLGVLKLSLEAIERNRKDLGDRYWEDQNRCEDEFVGLIVKQDICQTGWKKMGNEAGEGDETEVNRRRKQISAMSC